MSKEIKSERLCPTCKLRLEYKGMEDIHTGGRGLEIIELLSSIFTGLSFLAIAIRDLMVKRTTFDFYVCPKCRYTILVEDSVPKADNGEELDRYLEYRKRQKEVLELISEVKKASNS
jgi:hypothetical protein